jgi:hypothetical protein
MRTADIARLSQPYADGPDTGATGPSKAIGVQTPKWEALERRIFEDLKTDQPYGIGWWAPHPGTSRRILISDQLYACTTSVSTNLVEAGVHWLELLDAIDREDNFQADVVQMINGQFQMRARPRTTPLESLGPEIVRLHQVGVVRALSGALDCAAGTIIGVMALPLNILKADFLGVQRFFGRRSEAPRSAGEQLQERFSVQLAETVARVGPVGWLDWLLNFRNMLVHRGRRIEIGQFVPREPVLRDARGRPIRRARVITHLPLEPDRSDIEVHLEPERHPVLTEDVRQTLEGSMQSVSALVEAVGEQLAAAWEWRREHPLELPQPRAQWPRTGNDARPNQRPPFAGYAPGSYEYAPGMLSGHPNTMRRLLAAALMDHQREQWPRFD